MLEIIGEFIKENLTIIIVGVIITVVGTLFLYLWKRGWSFIKGLSSRDSTAPSIADDVDSETMEAKEVEEDDEYDEQRVALEGFKNEFENFARKIDIDYGIKRDVSKSPEEAKFIFELACDELIDFLASIVSDKDLNLSNILREAIELSEAIQGHRIRIDGGNSTRAFWEKGDQIITLLKKVPKEIDDILAS